jgi:deoxyribonuclease IV
MKPRAAPSRRNARTARRPRPLPPLPATAPPLGAHVSVAGGLVNSFKAGAELSCGAVQIFVKNASQWRGRTLDDEEVRAFRAARRGSCVGKVLAHASYLINLAATDPVILEKSRAALADELERCGRLGVDALVVHPGAHLGAGEEAGLALIAESIDIVLGALPGLRTRLLIENTAGQGTVLGWRLEHLARILELAALAADKGRLGVCIDTCHAFVAGYPVHEEAGYAAFWRLFDRLLGRRRLRGLHLNDSARPFASRRDRHANIGKGEIGLALFARLVNDRRLKKVPMIIETETEDDLAGHRRDLATLRRLLAAPAG